jgi:dephospho-CoA kinase
MDKEELLKLSKEELVDKVLQQQKEIEELEEIKDEWILIDIAYLDDNMSDSEFIDEIIYIKSC